METCVTLLGDGLSTWILQGELTRLVVSGVSLDCPFSDLSQGPYVLFLCLYIVVLGLTFINSIGGGGGWFSLWINSDQLIFNLEMDIKGAVPAQDME